MPQRFWPPVAGWTLVAFDFHSASNPDDPQLLDRAQRSCAAIGEARQVSSNFSRSVGRSSCSPAGRRLNPKPVGTAPSRAGTSVQTSAVLAKDRKEIRHVAVVWGGDGCFEQIESWPSGGSRNSSPGTRVTKAMMSCEASDTEVIAQAFQLRGRNWPIDTTDSKR